MFSQHISSDLRTYPLSMSSATHIEFFTYFSFSTLHSRQPNFINISRSLFQIRFQKARGYTRFIGNDMPVAEHVNFYRLIQQKNRESKASLKSLSNIFGNPDFLSNTFGNPDFFVKYFGQPWLFVKYFWQPWLLKIVKFKAQWHTRLCMRFSHCVAFSKYLPCKLSQPK